MGKGGIMILLHKDGVIVEAASIEAIRFLIKPDAGDPGAVEIQFASGKCSRFSDQWIGKGWEGKKSIYDVLLPDKIDWRGCIKI
jgi:hypothetical protein